MKENTIMSQPVSDIAFTPAVKAVQTRYGSRAAYAKMERSGGCDRLVTPELAAFIAARDSFYMATANAAGQPYIQHRGGPKGFLKILDDHTLAFADFRGNRQYITVGTLSENDKVCLFLMDYGNRRRVKIWGQARIEDDAALLAQLVEAGYQGQPERAIVIDITAWNANCPQHITPRSTAEEVAATVQALRQRIAVLEANNQALRDTIATLRQA
jgi:predicted pyridoxine 5'-phosphate oxidase superfamily flavin-nucleotide-binding protein